MTYWLVPGSRGYRVNEGAIEETGARKMVGSAVSLTTTTTVCCSPAHRLLSLTRGSGTGR